MKHTQEADRDEQDIARLLQAAGSREQLPDALKQSWEASFRAELAPVIQRRNWRRRGRTAALCASLAVVALLGIFKLQSPALQAPVFLVTNVVGDGFVSSTSGAGGAVASGQQVAADSVLTTADDGYLSIAYRGYDLRMNSGSQLRVSNDGVHLLVGEIYISNGQSTAAAAPITVHTAFATIRDIGTQFTVAVSTAGVVSTVRRGSIVVNTQDQEYIADASQSPHRVSVDTSQQVAAVAVSDQQWNWIYQVAPPFELEGSSAYDFLQWSAAETGLGLEFTSSGAEIYARTTTLHGDIANLHPERTLAPVLATTHLRAEPTAARTLLVSLLARD